MATTTFNPVDLVPFVFNPPEPTNTATAIPIDRFGSTFVFRSLGSQAVLTATTTNAASGHFELSVDGGAFSALSFTGSGPQAYTLYTGLSDDWHDVHIRAIDSPFKTSSLNSLTVTSASQTPAIDHATGYGPILYAGCPIRDRLLSCGIVNANGLASQPWAGTPIRVRGTFTSLKIFTASNGPWQFEVDGTPGTPATFSAISGNRARWCELATSDGVTEHQVTVFGNNTFALQALTLGGGAISTTAVEAPRILLAIGDSITQGVGTDASVTRADQTWSHKAARVEASGKWWTVNQGVAGITTVGWNAKFGTVIPGFTASPSAVSILLGENDLSRGVSAAVAEAEYGHLLDRLVASPQFARVLRIFCLEVLAPPSGTVSTARADWNAGIAAAVAARASDSRIVLVPSQGWTVTRTDGVHPSATGHTEMAALFAPYLATVPADALPTGSPAAMMMGF